MPNKKPANTLDSIEIPIEQWKTLGADEFATELRKFVSEVFEKRLNFYRGRQRSRWCTLQLIRSLTVLAGVAGILLTAAAAIVRYVNLDDANDTSDAALLLGALVAYALMAAVAFAERGFELSTSYFRAISTAMAMRDLRTNYMFEEAIEEQSKAADAEPASLRTKSLERAREFCTSLDTIVTKEATAWQTAYQEAAKNLSDSASAGLASSNTRFDAAMKTILEERAQIQKEQKEARDKLEAQRKPAALAVKVSSKGAGGVVTLYVDGQQRAQGAQREFAVTELTRGVRRVKVELGNCTDAPAVIERPINLVQDLTEATFDFG